MKIVLSPIWCVLDFKQTFKHVRNIFFSLKLIAAVTPNKVLRCHLVWTLTFCRWKQLKPSATAD